MFGILLSLLRLGEKTYYDVVQESYKQKYRIKAIQNGEDTYFDGNGVEWFIMKNGKDIRCSRVKDLKTHHDVLISSMDKKYKYGTILKDYTAIKDAEDDLRFKQEYNEKKQKAIEENEKYFYINLPGDKREGYYETDTGKQFIIDKGILNDTYYMYYIKSTKYKRETLYDSRRKLSYNEVKKLGGVTPKFLCH